MLKILFLFFLFSTKVNAQEALTAIRDNLTRTYVANVNKLGSKYALGIDSTPATTIYTGQVTVATAGTRVQVSTNSVSVRSVCVKALADNAGKIYMGNATDSATTGYELSADSSACADVNDLNLIYLDSSSSGDKASYLAVN